MTVRRWRSGAAALLLPMLLGACAATFTGWTKPGAGTAELRRDLVDCERQGTGPPPFHFWALDYDYAGARERIARVRDRCMLARGWRRD